MSIHDELESMVSLGAVDRRKARIWIRAPREGAYRVNWRQRKTGRQGERVVAIHEGKRDWTGVAVLEELTPGSAYEYSVTSDSTGQELGEGEFQTSPDDWENRSEPFSLAFLSCNQPFDKKGLWSQESGQMLKAARECMKNHATRRMFLTGDQMYADMPEGFSLFDESYFHAESGADRDGSILQMSPEEVRRQYHSRYRAFFAHPEWKLLQSSVPGYPMWDDHEIVDNWGSILEHQREKWKSLGQGAKHAYADYQAARLMDIEPEPADFHYQMEYGPVAAFAPDLRSDRTGGEDGHLMSPSQMDALENFLLHSGDKEILLLVLSVPILHLPKNLSKFAGRIIPTNEDFSDRWSSHGHVYDRDKVLRMLRENSRLHPQQRMIILSGDIHIGCAHKICFARGGSPLYQFISSPITHDTGFMTRTASTALIRMNRHFKTEDADLKGSVSFLPGTGSRRANPYGGLNLGLVEVLPVANGGPCQVRFLLYGHERGIPRCVYESPLL